MADLIARLKGAGLMGAPQSAAAPIGHRGASNLKPFVPQQPKKALLEQTPRGHWMPPSKLAVIELGDKAALLELLNHPTDPASAGFALQYASEALRADKEVVMAAVHTTGWALDYAAPHLKADKEVVLAAVRQNGWALRYAADVLRADKQVVMDAVRQSGWALEDAAVPLRADKQVVLEAVRHRGSGRWALRFAAPELRHDREIVLAATRGRQ